VCPTAETFGGEVRLAERKLTTGRLLSIEIASQWLVEKLSISSMGNFIGFWDRAPPCPQEKSHAALISPRSDIYPTDPLKTGTLSSHHTRESESRLRRPRSPQRTTPSVPPITLICAGGIVADWVRKPHPETRSCAQRLGFAFLQEDLKVQQVLKRVARDNGVHFHRHRIRQRTV